MRSTAAARAVPPPGAAASGVATDRGQIPRPAFSVHLLAAHAVGAPACALAALPPALARALALAQTAASMTIPIHPAASWSQECWTVRWTWVVLILLLLSVSFASFSTICAYQ